MAKKSVMIKHKIEEPYVDSSPILILTILVKILAKIIASDEDEAELKSFVHELVNDDEPNLFGLLLAVDYLVINGFLSLASKFLLFSIRPQFTPEETTKIRRENPWAFN
ncbi:hypothetical protein M9H77_34569 [Catharanthus roseus]|uniref:Uncharacterized protein n=1 Tax=Catharanthus roseus TaxID=4058 RepID=A0ACB9ZMF2_CATRO|nr:hypothetical protein M9H77_34569 [Catharanthus roseus]